MLSSLFGVKPQKQFSFEAILFLNYLSNSPWELSIIYWNIFLTTDFLLGKELPRSKFLQKKKNTLACAKML